MQVLRHMKRFEDVVILAGLGLVGIAIFALTRRGQRAAAAAEELPDSTSALASEGGSAVATAAPTTPRDGGSDAGGEGESATYPLVERRRGERRGHRGT